MCVCVCVYVCVYVVNIGLSLYSGSFFNIIFYSYDLEYKKNFSIRRNFFLNTINQIFMPVQICMANKGKPTCQNDIFCLSVVLKTIFQSS